jgi:hypothetical protein
MPSKELSSPEGPVVSEVNLGFDVRTSDDAGNEFPGVDVCTARSASFDVWLTQQRTQHPAPLASLPREPADVTGTCIPYSHLRH